MTAFNNIMGSKWEQGFFKKQIGRGVSIGFVNIDCRETVGINKFAIKSFEAFTYISDQKTFIPLAVESDK